MLILAVDDEKKSLNLLHETLLEVSSEHTIAVFTSPEDALCFVKKNKIDVAFIDAVMPSMSGIDLAKQIQNINPKTNIIIVASSKEYAYDAFEMNASGYILKPVFDEKVKKEMNQLRFPPKGKKIRIVCFGSFEAYLNDLPINFTRKKEKELLAYLVHKNGATCTNNEIMAELWEDDRDHSTYFYKLRSGLKKDLESHNCSNLVNFGNGTCSINKNTVDCDYFDYRDGNSEALNSYVGEYMAQYPWSDEMNGSIYSDKYF